MNEINIEKLIPFLVLIIPGFISLKTWSLFFPSEKKQMKDSIIEILCYSALNFAFFFWIFFFWNDFILVWKIVFLFIIFIIAPILWPISIKILLSIKFVKEKTVSPIPKAWDYFFNLRKECFMLIHLKNDKMIGGLYNEQSFASSFPYSEDLYLTKTYKIDKDGRFVEEIDRTMGLLINKDFIDYIELFSTKPEGENNGKE